MLTVEPVEYPLSAESLSRALRTGHGRAPLHLARTPSGSDDEILVAACLHHMTYDPQTHDPRGPRVADMAIRRELGEEVVKRIAAADNDPAEVDLFDLSHRCGVLAALARREVRGARDLLYSIFSRVPNSGDVVGLEEVVSLDGLDGLTFACARMGAWLEEDATFWVDDSALWYVPDELGGRRAGMDALTRGASDNRDLARFLRALDQTTEDRGHLEIPPALLNVGAGEVTEVKAAHATKMRGSRLALSLTLPAATAPLKATGSAIGAGMRTAATSRQSLRHSSQRMTPPASAGSSGYSGASARPGSTLACFPGSMTPSCPGLPLAPVRDDRVREAAVARLEHSDRGADFIRLLVANFADGDDELLERVLAGLAEGSDDRIHDVVYDTLDVVEASTAASVSIARTLLFIHERSPCENCRSRAFELLANRELEIPEWTMEEVRFDSRSGLRALVEGLRP